MAEDHSIAAQGGPKDASEGAPAHGGTPLVLPHRGAAILRFSLAGVGCLALTLVAGLLLRTGVVSSEEPEGELLLMVGLAALVGHLTLCPAAWAMATKDLQRMAEGRMDPAGKGITMAGKAIAMFFVLITVLSAMAVVVLALSGRVSLTLEAPLEGA